MQKFFHMNKFLLISQLLFIFSIFSYKITINPILIEHFNFSETILNYSNIFFSIGWFTGILIINELFKYKFNFFKHLKTLFIILFVIRIFEFSIIYLNNYNNNIQYSFIFIRLSEGFFTQIMSSIILNLLSYKMVNNRKNGSINGIINSGMQIIKFLAPLIGTLLILKDYPLLNMIFYFFTCAYLFIIFNLNEKVLLKEYHRYLLKKITRKKRKFNKFNKSFFKKSFNVFNIYKDFFKEPDLKKYYFTFTAMLNASMRNFYDFYLILYLINHYNYSLTESAFIFSMMILGMSFHFVSGMLSDKTNYILNIKIMYFFSFGLYLSLLTFEHNYMGLLIIIFLIGFLRTIAGNWEHKITINEFRNFKLNLEEAKRLLKLNVELGTIVGYIISSIVYFYYGFNGVIISIIITYVILMIISFIRDIYKVEFNI